MNLHLTIFLLTVTVFIQSIFIMAMAAAVIRIKKQKTMLQAKKSGKKLIIEDLESKPIYKIKTEEEKKDDMVLKEDEIVFVKEPAEEDCIASKIVSYCSSNEEVLDKDFQLDNLALKIGTNRNYVSRALNKAIKLNFNQLKNYFRVRKACSYFLFNPDTNLSQLFEISRFTSFTTFSIAFNKHTHFPPNKWCKDVLERISNGESVSLDDYLQPLKHFNSFEKQKTESS